MDQDATGLSANFNIKYVYRITLRHGYATIKGFLSLLFCFFFFLTTHVFVSSFANIPACKDNLDSFINMDPGTGFGVVLTLDQLFDRFHRPNAIPTAPRTPHPQPTPT